MSGCRKGPQFWPSEKHACKRVRIGIVGSHSAQILMNAHVKASCQPGTVVLMSLPPCLFRPTPGSCVQRWPCWTHGGWRMAALYFNYLISEWAGRATLAEPAQEPGLWGHQKEEGSETVSHAEEHKVSSRRTERTRVLYSPLGKNRISGPCFWATFCHCWQTRWLFFSKTLGFHQWE